MAGTVIENLSTRKLVVILLALLVAEIVLILIGAFIAPRPSWAAPSGMKSCYKSEKDWELPKICKEAGLDDTIDSNVPDHPSKVVFTRVIPPQNFTMYRWFQYVVGYLTFTRTVDKRVNMTSYVPIENPEMTFNFTLGYSDQIGARLIPEAWTLLANSIEKRTLSCDYAADRSEYDCEPVFAFQLGSVPHKQYVLNMGIPLGRFMPNNDERIDDETNTQIDKISDMQFIMISQTGGFTRVWLSIKTVLFIIMLFPTVWFWRRVAILARKSMLIEKSIFALALSLLFLNFPLEYLTIFYDVPWMLLVTDIRQGFFYAVLFSFWVIFMGEHLMDQAHRNKISAYRWHLGSIFTASFALLSFDLAERGIQIVNPFATIWTHPSFGYALLAIGTLAGLLYIILLLYLLYKVFRSISYKRKFILPDHRAVHFEAIVSRLKRLMMVTVLTAGLTVIFFFLQQTFEGLFHDFFPADVQVASAFFTGVYGLWNIYVFLVLSLYAPSHKLYEFSAATDENSENEMVALRSTTEQTQILQMTQLKDRED
ncbi:unnamed protein product [Clavelina lepadiformis]|uniref:Protein wntless n=1 Tax=Clavelina lepadiformis TaxID=159417 RepID=A0ABP0G0B0_CLALP